MDTILYLYPARRTAMCGTPPEEKAELRRGKLKKFLPFLWKKREDRRPVVTVSRTEYFFPDYHLVRVSVARTEGMEEKQAELALTELKLTELKLREQLQELTEDPDHTYVVCREPLSFYFGREFRDYLQQEWIEHLLRYGERPGGYPAWPDLVLLGRNPYLPYVVLRYAARLQSMKWYLTEREYREEEEWLTGELEDEYGLIPEIRLLAENADYGRVRLQGTKPCVVLDFCDNEKVYGGGLAAGSIWLDFPASEEKERRVASGCPQIRYFSMKKEWKDPRKAREYLDTISKNGYNNSVD
jgi:hypothetical protein